ncbi:flagellar FlbD family protein [Paenibacillus sp. GYB003]|uniref:flagellar FlbD family protein n=1 Tax=Paenibacillus sp. GYB003 TaxID=2994392 RepID=UPI002F96C8E6
MIKLTKHNGCPIWLNPDHIRTVSQDKYGTLVCDNHVNESPEEVVRKIMDYKHYKLAMSTFNSAHAASLLPHERKGLYEYAEEELNRLAGLEQTP